MVSEPSRSALKRERVRDYLMELVESRAPGDPIPSERTLCEQLGVSRPTLRSAVDELVTTGLLLREHGRGMFVARAKITQELAPDRDAHRLPQASGTWTSRVLEFTTVQAGARVGRRLHISPAADIIYIARLRLVDGEPMAIEYLHVPAALVPGLRPADMESGDFYDLLRERHGVRVHEAVQSIEPTVTNEEEATADRRARAVARAALRAPHQGRRPGGRWSTSTPSTAVTATASSPASPWATRPRPRRCPPARHHPGIPPGDLASREVPAMTTGDVQPGP